MLTYREIAEKLIAIYQETGKYAFDREQLNQRGEVNDYCKHLSELV